MKHVRVWPSVAVIITLMAALLPLVPGSQPAFAAHPQHQTAKAKTFFSCVWKGQTITLKHVTKAPVERYRDSVVAGKCSKFKTNDKYYNHLVGKSINVFVAWREYPGQFVVHNSLQGHQPVYGSWTFPIGLSAPATLAGIVTDSITNQPVAGATVEARHCVTKPVRACTTYTAVTDSTGSYLIRFYVQGSFKVTAITGGYIKSTAATIKVSFGNAMTTNVAIAPSATTTTLTLTANPNPVSVNQTTTLTATVAQPVADGTIAFSGTGPNGATFTSQMCTPVGGTCGVTWKPTSTGAWTISATWSGDTHFLQATNTVNVSVTALTTTLTLTNSPTQPAPNQKATVTATLGQSVSDGAVTFTASGPGGVTVAIGSCTPNSGSCTSTWTPTVAGTWTIAATWSGDGQYSPSNGSLQVAVGQGTVTVTVTPIPASPSAGQSVTLTATISQPVSDGTVTFSFSGPNGATSASQTCVPASGACSVTWTPSASGTWIVTASWSGDSGFNQASGQTTVSVGANTLHLTVSSSPNPLVGGQTGTLTAVLDHAVSDGTVTFTVTGPGAANLSATTCTPNVGTCSVTWKPTTSGTYTLTASWTGDSNYQPATSNTLSLTVTSTTLTLTASPTALNLNSSGTLTATLSQSTINDGTMSFIATGPNGNAVGVPTCVPVNGSCSVTWTPTTSGTWTITSSWTGDGTYPAATSAAITVTVTGTATLTLVPSPRSVPSGGNVNLDVTVANSQSGGTISFTGTDPNGAGVSITPCSPVGGFCFSSFNPTINGNYTITANWSGNSSYPSGATSSAVTVSVTGTAATSISVSASPNPILVNATGTLTAQLSPQVHDGSVSFSAHGPNSSSVSIANCTPNVFGTCTSPWTPNVGGTWVITATWSGDANYSASTSPSIQVTATLPASSLTVTANPASPLPNQQGSLTAMLNQSVNDGTITFSVTGPSGANANLNPTTCTPSSGVCTVHWQPDMPGQWMITATWSGDNQFAGSTGNDTVTVAGKVLSLSVTPNPVQVGTAASVKATIPNASGSDTVSFTVTSPSNITTSLPSCSISAVQTSCTVSWTPNAVGTWTVTASSTGADPTAPVSTQVIVTGTLPSSMVVSTNPTSPVINQNVTVTAALAQSVNDGTITFSVTDPSAHQTTLASCVPANGACTTTWTPNSIGSWTITAQWTGDSTYAGTSNTDHVTVMGVPATLTLSSTPNSPVVNQQITVTGTLTSTGGTPNDGTITFTISGPGPTLTPSCTPSSGGACSVTFTPTATGTYTVSASYGGSATYGIASAGPSNIVVAGAPISITLSSSPPAPVVAQSNTLTAMLSRPVTDGTVTFSVVTKPSMASANFSSSTCSVTGGNPGTCQITWSPDTVGTWQIKAEWSGDSQYALTNITQSFTVVAQTTTLTLTSSPTSPVHGVGATLTATLGQNSISDGTVTFSASGPAGSHGNVNPTTCTPSAGACTVNWNPDTAGSWSVTANWAGDLTHAAATQTINVTVT